MLKERAKKRLDEFQSQGRLRRLNEIAPLGKHALFNGRRLLNLSSNDYLGLMARDDLRCEFYAPLKDNPADGRFLPSAASSRLLTGNHPAYGALEADLGALYGRSALAFNSGYHANVGIIPALAGPRDLILCDKLNHASIIDGVLLSGARYKRYPHLDLARLEELLRDRADYDEVFIITESVFSMDGDEADLKALVELKKRYDATLIVDEAHGVGVRGARGLGLCEEAGVTGDIDVIIGTFGKALSSAGAYGIMDGEVREYLVNVMRPFIFTTALPPVVVEWTRFALRKSLDMAPERANLAALGERLRRGLAAKGHRVLGSSQIVPLVLGDNQLALDKAEELREAGFLVFAIRPPTVPPGGARLRFSLTAGLGMADLDQLLEAL